MRRYWRLKTIPELCELSPRDRREWWREAMTHGRTVQSRLMVIAAVAVAVMLADRWPGIRGWIPLQLLVAGGVAGVLGLAVDHWYVQPRARRWLRGQSPCSASRCEEDHEST